jgi:hypothetical protein
MPPVSSAADVPLMVMPSAPSASVKHARPAAMPGHVGASTSSKCADAPGTTRSSSATTAETLPRRCDGKLAGVCGGGAAVAAVHTSSDASIARAIT